MAKHDDVAEDKKLIKSMVKPSAVKKGMKKGGVTGKEMRAVGRNMARAMNQKSSSRGR
jgi:hypothetical protein